MTSLSKEEIDRIEKEADRRYPLEQMDCEQNVDAGLMRSGYITGARAECLRAKEKARWVNVEERLPDPDEWVLVRTDYHGTVYYHYAECIDGKFVGSEYSIHSATHWMPLPDPPKEVC